MFSTSHCNENIRLGVAQYLRIWPLEMKSDQFMSCAQSVFLC